MLKFEAMKVASFLNITVISGSFGALSYLVEVGVYVRSLKVVHYKKG